MAAALERVIERLRFGTVCINQFAGLAYLRMSTPWGGFPGGTLADPGSGVGFAHNTDLLDGIDMTVFGGPFRISPLPLWFPSNRNLVRIARALNNLYLRPSPGRWCRCWSRRSAGRRTGTRPPGASAQRGCRHGGAGDGLRGARPSLGLPSDG